MICTDNYMHLLKCVPCLQTPRARMAIHFRVDYLVQYVHMFTFHIHYYSIRPDNKHLCRSHDAKKTTLQVSSYKAKTRQRFRSTRSSIASYRSTKFQSTYILTCVLLVHQSMGQADLNVVARSLDLLNRQPRYIIEKGNLYLFGSQISC
jgi:hypothetical protein